jgi:hypothetical protein
MVRSRSSDIAASFLSHIPALARQRRLDAGGFGFQLFGRAQARLPDRRFAGAFGKFPVPRRQLP